MSRENLPRLSVLFVLVLGCGAPPASGPIPSDVPGSFPDDRSSPSWSQWGGPNGDFTVGGEGLADSWPPGGPRVVWSRPLGGGYAAIVSDGGALFTGYRDANDDVFVALRADDGSTIWEHRYPGKTHEGNTLDFGAGPNATPLVLADRIITLGFGGALKALDPETGEPIWSHDLIAEFGGEILDFGYSASPILHDRRVVVLVGGEQGAVVAFRVDDGTVAWNSPPGGVSYSTPIVIDVDGHEQLVYFSAEEVIGLDARSGERLWSHPCRNQYLNNATNLTWGDDHLLWVATQLDGGTRVLRLTHDGERTHVEEVWAHDKIKIHHWNSVRFDGHVYASIGGVALIVAGIDVRTGEIKWRERGFENANFVHAGDKSILLDANGELALVKLSPDAMEVLSRTTVIDGETWTVPTLVGTTLYIRDNTTLRALDLAQL